MDTFTHDQKVALLVVPILLFGVLGLSSGNVGVATLFEEEVTTRTRPNTTHEEESSVGDRVRKALVGHDYKAFVAALTGTPYREYATPEVFDALISGYTRRMNNSDAHDKPEAHFDWLT